MSLMRYFIIFILLLFTLSAAVGEGSFDIPERGPDGRRWDLIIIGGGPSGLAAARIARTKHDLTVLLIEKRKFSEVKAAPRGETINPIDLVDEVWGEGFLEEITIKKTLTNIFYSPRGKKISYMDLIETPYSFHWEKYISLALERLGYDGDVSKPGLFSGDEGRLVMVTGLAVDGVIFEDENGAAIAKGVKTGAGEFRGHTVFDCSGHNSPIGKALGLNYSDFNMPVMKCEGNIDRSKFPYLSFEPFRTFFIPSGSTKGLKGAPPAFTMIFPQDSSGDSVHLEIIAMLFANYGAYGVRGGFSPAINEEYLKRVWEEIKATTPLLSELMAEVEFDYQYLTAIPLKSMVVDEMAFPGLVMLGDAAGFVISSTGSGLITGMEDALWWTAQVAEMKGRGEEWDGGEMKSVNDEFKKTSYYSEVKNANWQTNLVQNIVWGMMVRPEVINFNWGLIMWGYDLQIKMTATAYFNDSEEFMAITPFKQQFIINQVLKKQLFGTREEKRLLEVLAALKEEMSSTEWHEFISGIDIYSIYERVSPANMEAVLAYFEGVTLLDCRLYLEGKGMAFKSGRIERMLY